MNALVIPDLPTEGAWGDLSHVPSWLDDDEIPWNAATIDQGGRARWRDWRKRLDAYRQWMHAETDRDPALRQEELTRCAGCVKYFLAVYGWIYEPRDHVDPDELEPGWRPWALMPHQVLLLDEINEAMNYPSPRGDVVVEKSRDMGATWTFCGWVAWNWLFRRVFTAGMMSYRQDEVTEDHPDSMFYKVKSVLGIDAGQPGVPKWMFPQQFWAKQKELDHKATLRHPKKSNFIRGETMTVIAGSGNRTTVRVHDEAAKWRVPLGNVMSNTASVTQHRFTLSSAYVEMGDDFKKLADFCKSAKPGTQVPRFVRLEPKLHPLHDNEWLENERDKYKTHDRLADFEREVMMSYRTGNKYIYTELVERCPVLPDLVWDPMLTTFISMDIGLADDHAGVVAQTVPRPDDPDPLWRRTYDVRWLDGYRHNGEGADYYAHIYTGIMPEPGDSAYLAFFSSNGTDLRDRRTIEFMVFMSTMPWSSRDSKIYYTGDPSGKAREQSTRTSFYKELRLHSFRLRKREVERRIADGDQHAPKPVPINVMISDLYPYRTFQARQQHMRPVLMRSSFAQTPGAMEGREALLNAHRLDPTPRQTNDPGMAHDEYSHFTSAFEFLAVYIRVVGLGWPKQDPHAEAREMAWLMKQPPGPLTNVEQRRYA